MPLPFPCPGEFEPWNPIKPEMYRKCSRSADCDLGFQRDAELLTQLEAATMGTFSTSPLEFPSEASVSPSVVLGFGQPSVHSLHSECLLS